MREVVQNKKRELLVQFRLELTFERAQFGFCVCAATLFTSEVESVKEEGMWTVKSAICLLRGFRN